MRSGFTTRLTAKEARQAKKVASRAQPAAADLRRLGTAGAKQMNTAAAHPEMPPSGSETPLVYVLGDAPGEVDDKVGEPFMGKAGQLLRKAIPRQFLHDTRFDNCVRTKPPDGRVPTPAEIECFRDTVTKSIVKAKPFVVLGLGNIPLKWVLPPLSNVKVFRGKKYAVNIGGHVCWFIPTLHPILINQIQDRREDKVPGEEWLRFWQQDIKKAYSIADACYVDAIEGHDGDMAPYILPVDEFKSGTVHCLTIEAVEAAIEKLLTRDEIGCDIENHKLRPYHKDSLLLSLSFSDGVATWAIPFDHPESPWAPNGKNALQRPVLIDLIKKLFTADGPRIVAHNLPHEYEWFLHRFGTCVYDTKWGCSLNAAFALNQGPPGGAEEGRSGKAGHSLEDVFLELFGVDIKGLTPGAKWRDRLRERPLGEVLDYNALDAKGTLLALEELRLRLDKHGLMPSYKLQIQRIPAIVTAQFIGVPVDQKVRQGLEAEITGKIEASAKAIKALPEVVKFEKQSGRVFSPTSPQQVSALLKSLRIPELAEAGGSTSAKLLEGLRGVHPIIDNILVMRGLSKLLGTYVQRFDPKHEDTYVYPDGRIHCQLGISRTRTARLASESPNNQNWPKRKNKHVRKQLAAPPGYLWVSVDQGQIEARVLAMESCDPTWIRMIEDDYDVHTEWAQKIADADDEFMALLKKDPKAARNKAKNGWVFPAFYGSSLGSIIQNCGIDDEEAAEGLFEEFWRVFAGVKKWQRRQWNKYERDGYVMSLTGRRRWGPLSYNMVINTPIQCTASDICVDAMVRLFWRSVDEGRGYLAPVLQIHDDLTFLIPEEHLSYAIQAIVEEQLGYKAEWLNVPLAVEVDVGQNLCEMESLGKWNSKDVEFA